ncbi:DNA gyrase subunit A, partial [Acidithiobacillus sp.]|uniref:DNA gyrase subunit A n=1 Tax=Acidithiobacillus sp. TaxID=1872118 RepID=UPI003CFF16FD
MSQDSIIERDICTIIKSSYADYAMSVITSRALPDIRDGLKPVHRRIIYSMYNLSLDYNKPHKKSARVVGDTIGKYHPHGDVAVYDSMVRMAQDFSMRYPLINGQGNFGSVDGDSPAAMRYTEVRMEKITREFVADLDHETVEMAPNYDEKETEPTVLPVTFPHLLVNGASGIAVGMSTNIPPHNIRNVIEALLLFIKDPSVDDSSLISLIEGPDFPTGGKIMGIDGIISSYILGSGRIVLRGKYHIEERHHKQVICITEIPY